MKNVLVTGAGGFIGSHLCERLAGLGVHVVAFVHYNSNGSAGWLDHSPVKKDVRIVAGDVRDLDSVRDASKGCDTIFHLAALIGIPYSYTSPLAYVRTNVEGTYNVLESVRTHGISQVLVTSTSETYGTAQYTPIDERHPSVGQSPYAATKVAADQLSLSYHRSFGSPVKVVRPFNTYGPRQSARAIIPTVISQILAGERRLKLGSTTPTRDLTFVTDTVEGFVKIASSDALLGKATNIGMGTEISIGDLVKQIAQLMNVTVEIVRDDQRVRPELSEVERLLCDASQLRKETGWRPTHDLASGLAATIEWLKQNGTGHTVGSYAI